MAGGGLEFNDGSQYRVVTNPNEYKLLRPMYEFRATSKHKDTAFDKHRKDFYGYPSLMYHFPYQDAGLPEEQADFFLSVVGKPLDTDMYMLDTEMAGKLRNPFEFALRWFHRVESQTGKLCWIYVPKDLSGPLNRKMTGPRIVKAPRYSGGPNKGAAPNWQWDVWQYTDRGYFPGCSQSGDCNFTEWSVAALLDRCNGGQPGVSRKGKPNILLLGG